MVLIINKQEILEKYAMNQIDVGGLKIGFQRTCRVPEGKINSLPAGLGAFPIYKVADFANGAPNEWNKTGYFMPMYRQEAMWMSFSRYTDNPKALIVGAGNINAITGKPFDAAKGSGSNDRRKKQKSDSLDIKLDAEQNYMVVPPQPWLDGWKAEDNKIYQFVAAEMGSGETVEGQITGEEKAGGIQLITYDPKPGQKLIHETRPHEYVSGGFIGESIMEFDEVYSDNMPTLYCCSLAPNMKSLGAFRSRGVSEGRIKQSIQSMGLGRGGEIEQKIYPDPYGLKVWNEKPTAVDIVYLVSSEDFKQITGHAAPPTPVTYEMYQKHGMPWFDLHDQKYKDTQGSDIFAKLKPVGEGKKH